MPAATRSRALAVAVLVAALAALAGCGDSGPADTVSSGRPLAGGGGQLGYALPTIPANLDPLEATSHDAQLITLQEHEPLVGELDGPYGDRSHQPGLAISLQHSKDRKVWALHLRPAVRFHDGTSCNAAAVLANARRWRSLPAGQELFPGLLAADAPRPDIVRFRLASSTPNLRGLLASPRLGIVSPEALRPHNGQGARVAGNLGGPGTGPFQLSQVTPDRIMLARNAAWWGGPLGLGPALDGLEFRAAAAEPERRALLEAGEVQVAERLSAQTIEEIRHEPLLTALPGSAGIGLQRSVRGIDSPKPAPFSDVWLTTVGGAP
jgi:ABC-type transport system substrate-binding protein